MKGQNKNCMIAKRAIAVIMLTVLTFCMAALVFADGKASVSLRIEGDASCLYYENEEIVAGSTLKDLLSAVNAKTSLNIVGIDANYITSIGGIDGGKYKGWDGWLYSVNGVIPSVGIDQTTLKDGDVVVMFYGDPYGVGMQFPEIEVKSGKLVFYSMDTEYDPVTYAPSVKKNPVASANVSLYDATGKKYDYVTDENGEIVPDALFLKEGTYKYSISKVSDNGIPLVLRSASDATYKVEATVETSDMSLIFVFAAIVAVSFAGVAVRKKRD